MRPVPIGLAIMILALVHAPAGSAQDHAASFKAKIKPFLEAHCIDCHVGPLAGAIPPKAGLSDQAASRAFAVAYEIWGSIGA